MIERPASTLGLAGTDDPLHCFLMATEPSQAVIHGCIETLLSMGDAGDGMLLIGLLRPIKRGNQPPTSLSPQLRGIRIHRCRLPASKDELRLIGGSLPSGCVEYGWFPCLRDDGDVRLCFAFQNQQIGADGTGLTLHRSMDVTPPLKLRSLSPALVPLLPSVGYRMWRRGQNTFALAPKSLLLPEADWDVLVRHFLQFQSGQTDSEVEG